MKELIFEDTIILVGSNVNDNQQLIDKYNQTDYIWFHLKAYPSSHVVILDNKPSDEIILYAATICKNTTKYKNLRGLKVNYTPYNNVQKTNKPGTVTFKSNRKVKEIIPI